MTPKEKADELYLKYIIATWIKLEEIKYLTTIPTAKECALIAVDEILSLLFLSQAEINYWQKVKNEIEKI